MPIFPFFSIFFFYSFPALFPIEGPPDLYFAILAILSRPPPQHPALDSSWICSLLFRYQRTNICLLLLGLFFRFFFDLCCKTPIRKLSVRRDPVPYKETISSPAELPQVRLGVPTLLQWR